MRRPWIALAIALVVQTAIFVVCRSDFFAADPLWYASIAHTLSVDPASVFAQHDTHPFVMRIGLTMPLALFYRAFGVSTLVTNLPCLLAADGVILVVYSAVSTPRAKLLGMVLCIACVPMFHQLMLNVDLPAAALMGCSILYLARRHRSRWWVAAAIVAWFAAFLVKETAMWCAPIWIYAIVRDGRDGGWRSTLRTYAPAIVVGCVLVAGYLVLCVELWADPLARIRGIQQAVANVRDAPTYRDAWALAGTPTSEWIARLVWRVPRMLVEMFGATLVLVALAPWLVRGRDRIWWWAAVTIVVFYWFGSSTTAAYLPLPISQRLLIPVLPFILVTATLAGDAALDRWHLTRVRLGLAIVVALAIVVPPIRAIHRAVAHGRPGNRRVRGAASRGRRRPRPHIRAGLRRAQVPGDRRLLLRVRRAAESHARVRRRFRPRPATAARDRPCARQHRAQRRSSSRRSAQRPDVADRRTPSTPDRLAPRHSTLRRG